MRTEPFIIILRLYNTCTFPTGVLGILNALRNTKNGVRSLKLQSHELGDAGAGHIADFLMEGHQIVSLDLMSNGIGSVCRY